jgi:CheY-like chemotaxis protein
MKKILILDDDEVFQKTMKASFDAALYSVVAAGNGEDGLKKMEEGTPDVILLDVMMPKMNGLDFLRKVNEKYGEGRIPVFITSNTSSMENISEGVSLGIRGYIVKSNESLRGIVESIEKVLKK